MGKKYLAIILPAKRGGAPMLAWMTPYPAALERDEESAAWLRSLIAEGGEVAELGARARELRAAALARMAGAESPTAYYIARFQAQALLRLEAGLYAIEGATGNPRAHVFGKVTEMVTEFQK